MAKSNKSADTGEGETSAPVTPVGKTKLHYAFNTTSVNIIEHTAEKASEMKKDHIVQEHSFSIADVPDVLQDGDIQKSLAGYGLQKLLQDRTSGTKDAGAKLAEMKVALTSSDGEKLLQTFSAAKKARDEWLEKHGEGL